MSADSVCLLSVLTMFVVVRVKKSLESSTSCSHGCIVLGDNGDDDDGDDDHFYICNRVYCIHVPGHDPITFSFRSFSFLIGWGFYGPII